MPKRSAPIVPAAASQPRKKKNKQREQKSLFDDAQPSPPPAGDDHPVEEATEPLSIIRDAEAQARAADGLQIVRSADKSTNAARFVSWMLAPLSSETFVREYYGQRPLLIVRSSCPAYFDGWFSTACLDRMLREHSLRWTDDVDAARYVDGERLTLNGEGVAQPQEAWARYKEGCSLRLSWPQRHSEQVWAMLSQLEEYFGSGAGANVYLTPPGEQGFAPHWDDIDAFVLQLEGSKTWRVYAPRSVEESLPRFSSTNLEQEELGRLVGEVTLRPGDILYLPRGVVHQAVATPTSATPAASPPAASPSASSSPSLPAVGSLHITLSVGRQHTWRDLLEFGLWGALDAVTAEHAEWRETLPPELFDTVGVLHANDGGLEAAAAAEVGGGAKEDVEGGDPEEGGGDGEGDEGGSEAEIDEAAAMLAARRASVGDRLRSMLHELVDALPLDAACDQFACQRFLFDRLPPHMAHPDAARVPQDEGAARKVVQLTSRIRLATRRCARLAIEEGVAAVYFCTGNTRVHHGLPSAQHIDFAIEAAPAIDKILSAYPKFVSVAKLPADSDAQRLDIARAFAEAKLVLVRPAATEKSKDAKGRQA